MNRRKFCILGLMGIWMGFIQSGLSQVNPSVIDSTLWILSLPELQSHRAYYVQELQVLQEEKQNLIQRGIDDGERLLEMKPDTEVIDEILIRLADLYYYKEKDEYITQMELYDEKLDQGLIEELPEEPRLDYSRSLEIYQRIIDEFPNSEMVDDAVYNKGFLFEEMGQNQKANQIYQHLINAYLESKYVPESYMRLGEFHFNPPVNEIDQAIFYYKKVLQYRDNPRYDEALYKIGWSYYRLSEYPEAISYFTTLIEDLEAVEKYDALGLGIRADLRGETIDYIAISFIDFGGPIKAREYIEKIGDPEWGWDVLKKLGNIYMQEKEDYPNAIAAYQTLLGFAPTSPEAPVIQRKIVDCYQSLNDEIQAFNFRQELFLTYKSDGTWWREITDEKAKLQAYKLAEQALRENINSLLKKAEENSSESLYKEAVDQGKTYLETFPEDLNAYTIRWNVALILDTKLHLYTESLQEYLTISMVYNEKKYQEFAREKGLSTIKDAAENAVVVADSVVQREWRQSNGVQSASGENGTKEPIPLTAAESWLAMAYDNYIKLFPFDKNVPKIMANAGALYYTHNQYAEAVKYFKTLMKYFPQSEEVRYAQYSILESYFGKGDYKSAEILAKKLMEESQSEEMRQKAEKRFGEAIFLKAQAKADAGQISVAASEFYRMALEVSSLEFADRALFNAGRAYEKVGDYPSAIRAYELLRVSYNGSPLLLDALNNLAFDYGEIGEYQKGGERYDALADLRKEGEGVRDALYNAFIFYGKANNWLKAVEAGEKYVDRYPDNKDASTIYFSVGKFYQKMNNDEGFKRVFSDFALRFPDSPLSLEAYFNLGKFYLEKDSTALAETTFLKAYTMSKSLKARALEFNNYYAVEGLFFASRLLHDRFKQISFFLPQNTLNRQVTQKQTLLRQLVSQHTRVAAFRTQRLPESVFRIGEAYENFAQTWNNQEVPPMNPTSRAIKEKEINERTTQIYNQSLTAYGRAMQVLERVMDNANNVAQNPDTTDSSAADTLTTFTQFWYEKTKEKISETLYRMAEVNARSIDRLLRVPVPGDLKEIARLEYRSQVLSKAIKPLLDVVVETHYRNLHVADSLGLENQWIEASRDKILSSLILLGQKYDDLAFDALREYEGRVEDYRKTTLNDKQRAEDDAINTIVNLIEYSKSYSRVTLAFYKKGIEEATKTGFSTSEILSTQDETVRFVLRLADFLEKLIIGGNEDQQKAEKLFQEAGELLYEDALAVFEDNVFFLKQNMKTLLENAYTIEKDFKLASPSGGWIGVRLVRMDPDTYSKQLNIPIVSKIARTDTTWWFSPSYQDGWESLDFEMIGWYHPRNRMDSDLLWDVNHTHSSEDGSQAQQSRSIYIRKEILIPGYPISGKLSFSTTSPHWIYLNGLNVTENSDEEAFPLSKHLRQGTNLVALELSTKGDSSMEGSILIQFIPERVLPQRMEGN